MSETNGDDRADVELRLPAEGAYATVVRTTAAGLAARLDFTIDDIEDLRIAIGEATALAIPAADPGTDLVACFYFGRGSMTVVLEVEAMDDPPLDTESGTAETFSGKPAGGRLPMLMPSEPPTRVTSEAPEPWATPRAAATTIVRRSGREEQCTGSSLPEAGSGA